MHLHLHFSNLLDFITLIDPDRHKNVNYEFPIDLPFSITPLKLATADSFHVLSN
jgi:hypothetical protein